MNESLEQRIQTAREANLALYLADPSPDSARLLVTFERTVAQVRKEAAAKEAARPHNVPEWSGNATATAYVPLTSYDVASSARQLPDGLTFETGTGTVQ